MAISKIYELGNMSVDRSIPLEKRNTDKKLCSCLRIKLLPSLTSQSQLQSQCSCVKICNYCKNYCETRKIIDESQINEDIKREYDKLKNKMEAILKREEERYTELANEVSRLKGAMEEKENNRIRERNELNKIIVELNGTIDASKKELSELTIVCEGHKMTLAEKEEIIVDKDMKLHEKEVEMDLSNCQCGKMVDEIENLKTSIKNEIITNDELKFEFANCYNNYLRELKIKDKMITDQNESMKKMKKETEKMTQIFKNEFEELKNELYSEKHKNKSLRITSSNLEEKLQQYNARKCEKCSVFEEKLHCLFEQKEKVMIVAKFTAKKLLETTNNYQKQIECEKQQHKLIITKILREKDNEIDNLKREIFRRRILHKKTCKNI